MHVLALLIFRMFPQSCITVRMTMPQLRNDVPEVMALLGNESDAEFVDAFSEMSPQFYVGPAASGAPMHWCVDDSALQSMVVV